jgi:hypothetical protein
MKSPKEQYKFLKTIDNIWDLASSTLFEKYIIKNLKGYSKLLEIDSTDQESLIMTRNGGYPIPGMIYTFIYKGKELVLEYGKGQKKEFIDYIPLVFCMNNAPGYFNGINLNMLPEKPRLDFLQSYYEIFEDFFIDVERLTENNKLAINKKFIEYIKDRGTQRILHVFNLSNKANFNYAFRRYNIPLVDNIRLIEYSEWNYIPFYKPSQAFRTLPVNQIHQLYYRSK